MNSRVEPIPSVFERFKADRTRDFERIARKTRGTHDANDLKSEAWFIAIEIGTRRSCRMDLSHPAEQDQVLAWIYKRFVDFVYGKLTESIDAKTDDEQISWHDRLSAPEESNPLLQILRLTEEQRALPMKGYSQFSAYMILLKRCELSLVKLADYLAVSFMTLTGRVQRASEHADIQPSLFDATESIDQAFFPRSYWLVTLWARCKGLIADQLVWPKLQRIVGVRRVVLSLDL